MPAQPEGNGKRGCSDPCPICGRTVSRASDMKRHMKTHDDSAKISCPFGNCNFRTLQRSNLNTHIRRHTNERIFLCQDDRRCKFDTVDSASLLRHRKRRHDYLPSRRIVFSVRQKAPKKKKQTKQKKKQATKEEEKKDKECNPTPASPPRRGRASRAGAVNDGNGMGVDVHLGPSELPAPSHSSPVPSMSYNIPEPHFNSNKSPYWAHPTKSNSPSPSHENLISGIASYDCSRCSGASDIEPSDSPPTYFRVYDLPEEMPVHYSRPLESAPYPQQHYENPYSPTFIARPYPQSDPSRVLSPSRSSHPSSPQHEYHRLPLHGSHEPPAVGRYQPYRSHYSSRPSTYYSDRGSRGKDYPPNASYLFGHAPRGYRYIPPVLASSRAHSPALSSLSYHHHPRRLSSSSCHLYNSLPYSRPALGESSPYSISAPEGQSIFILRPACFPDNTSDSASTDEDSLDSSSLYSNGSFSVHSPVSSVRSSIGPNEDTVTSALEMCRLNPVVDIPVDLSNNALLRSPDLRRSERGI